VSDVLLGRYEKATDLSGVSGVSLACYDVVRDKFQTCYEEVTRELLPWSLALREQHREENPWA